MGTNILRIASFMSTITDNTSSDVIVVSTDTSIVKVFNGVGFDSEDEYINSYPGKFRGNSDVTKEFLDKTVDLDKIDPNKNYNINVVTLAVDNNLKAFKDITFLMCFESFFMLPTIEEIKSCIGLENLDYKDLWFCSDWEETDNDS